MALLVCVAACVVISCGGTERRNVDLQEALKHYRENDLEQALPLLEAACEKDQNNADAHAWCAETYRRLGSTEKARSAARRAIAIDNCHSFAHIVLAEAFNPLHQKADDVHSDSTWNHLLRAVDCDSTDGNGWLSIWTEAIRRGQYEIERKALRKMVATNMLTPTLLSYNRWMLRNLPENAIIVTNGDMDTYPAVAIQEAEGFRNDVAVVNFSLLNTPWYARFVSERYRVPLPFEETELNLLKPYMDEDGNQVLVAMQILQGWLEARKSGAFSRPITISVTAHENVISPMRSHLALEGAFWSWNPEPVESAIDTAMLRSSLRDVRPEEFRGSFVSSQDRSPVRGKYSNGIVRNVTSVALRYAEALIESGHTAEAIAILDWAEEFEKNTILGSVFGDEIQKLREAVRN